jgi:hypothetical protein
MSLPPVPESVLSRHPDMTDEFGSDFDCLVQTEPPRRMRRHPLGGSAEWLTWAPGLLGHLRELGPGLGLRGRLRIEAIPACEPYPLTYSLTSRTKEYHERPSFVRALASQLCGLALGAEPTFFRGLFFGPVTPGALRRILAAVRDELVSHRTGANQAMSPPCPRRARDTGFPLHADLFHAPRLLLIFGDLNGGSSSRTLLLPRCKLVEFLSRPEFARHRVLATVERLIDGPYAPTAYERLFQLLHDPGNLWNESLSGFLTASAATIRFEKGEGYLIRDRQWLHGREATGQPVSSSRFTRLVF